MQIASAGRGREGSYKLGRGNRASGLLFVKWVNVTSVVRSSASSSGKGREVRLQAGHPRVHKLSCISGPQVYLVRSGQVSPISGALAPLDPRRTLGLQRRMAATSGGQIVPAGASPPSCTRLPGCFSRFLATGWAMLRLSFAGRW